MGAVLAEGIGNLQQGSPRRLRRIGFKDGGIGAVSLLAHRVIVGGSEHRDILAAGLDLFQYDVTHPALVL